MMAAKHLFTAAFLGVAALAAGEGQAQTVMGRTLDGVLACESQEGRYRECRANTRNGVRLVRQLSTRPCIEGRTWGTGRDSIWVNDGCRAEFAVGGRSYGYDRDDDDRYRYGWQGDDYGNRYGQGWNTGRSVMCASYGSRPNRCPMDTRYGVDLVRQISSKRCVEGRNWGVGNGDVWVDHGCRAEFVSRSRNDARRYGDDWREREAWRDRSSDYYGYGYGGNTQVLHCASLDGRQNYCRAAIYRGVTLQRQLSRASCVRGQTWGWDRGGIWVRQGCRAEFAVY